MVVEGSSLKEMTAILLGKYRGENASFQPRNYVGPQRKVFPEPGFYGSGSFDRQKERWGEGLLVEEKLKRL